MTEDVDPQAVSDAWMDRARAAEEALRQMIEDESLTRIPVRRSTDQLIQSLCQLTEETLAELRHIRAALGASGSVSSVELTVDSKAIVKPTVKVYSLDAAAACEQAQTLFDDLIIKYGGNKA
jgi:hypothetical protein